MRAAATLIMAGLCLAGCSTEAGRGGAQAAGAAVGAAAEVRNASGQNRARADTTQLGDGIRIAIAAEGMAPGTYAAHVQAVGRCDPPDFTSAGPHWNPTNRQHGKDNPQGMHKGDLPNLLIGADGRGSLEFVIRSAAVRGGAAPLLDADGAAVVIHASPDDNRTDPSGNAGARLACGVLG